MSYTDVATNEIERSGQMCNVLEVEWIVHIMVDCEETEDKAEWTVGSYTRVGKTSWGRDVKKMRNEVSHMLRGYSYEKYGSIK